MPSTRIDVELEYFRGSITPICVIPKTIDPRQLSELIATNQLMASRNGKFIAMIDSEAPSSQKVVHNIPGMTAHHFRGDSPGLGEQTRILEVDADHIVVFGLPPASLNRGIYEIRIGQKTANLVYPISRLTRVYQTKHGPIYFGVMDEEAQACTDNGAWTLHSTVSSTTLCDKSTLLLELVENQFYRYRVTSRGFEDWSLIKTQSAELPVSLIRLQNAFVALMQSPRGSSIRCLTQPQDFSFPLPVFQTKRIEWMSVSPDEKSLAWCVRPNGPNTSERQLYLNGELFYKGSFIASRSDVTWAPMSAMCGVRISTFEETGIERQYIVTPSYTQEMPINTLVREFLVDPDGRIDAIILDNGHFCQPFIDNKPHDAVPLAWNLHRLETGGFGFNSVIGNQVYLTINETNLVRH